MELITKLRRRASDGNPIRVGIIGCGQMGSGLAHTMHSVTGMAVSAIADIDPQRAIGTFMDLGYQRQDILVNPPRPAAEDAIRKRRPVVTEDTLLMPALDGLEANVEATGVPDIGARVAYDSIMNHKPIIMLNVETDITIGWYLDRLARRMGTVYTVASGDEPGVCKMLYEQALLMGFEVITLGKGKNNTIDLTATADSCHAEALSKDMNPKMLAAFKDGTKTMVEMCAVANATGLLPDVPGMHGPKVELDDLVKVYIPAADGGIMSRTGTVDYSTGAIAPGVFAIVRSHEARIRKEMKFITRADGPYYLHFRPYHLCDLETPQSVAEAVLLGEVTVTAENMNAEVVCVAKRDIMAGETLGGIGGPDWYGRILTYPDALAAAAVPIGIGAGARVLRSIKKGQVIRTDAVQLDESSFVCRLRRLQDSLLAGDADRSGQTDPGSIMVGRG
jgi:predicted homoserine dehydrogenase-like protein